MHLNDSKEFSKENCEIGMPIQIIDIKTKIITTEVKVSHEIALNNILCIAFNLSKVLYLFLI